MEQTGITQEVVMIAAGILFALVPAIVLHEFAHGFVANKLGDSTAKDAGRLSLNPIKHIDLVGTILLPGFLLIFPETDSTPVHFVSHHLFRVNWG